MGPCWGGGGLWWSWHSTGDIVPGHDTGDIVRGHGNVENKTCLNSEVRTLYMR